MCGVCEVNGPLSCTLDALGIVWPGQALPFLIPSLLLSLCLLRPHHLISLPPTTLLCYFLLLLIFSFFLSNFLIRSSLCFASTLLPGSSHFPSIISLPLLLKTVFSLFLSLAHPLLFLSTSSLYLYLAVPTLTVSVGGPVTHMGVKKITQ